MANPPFMSTKIGAKLNSKTKPIPHGNAARDNGHLMQLFYAALNDKGRAGFDEANSAADAAGSEDIRRQP